MQLSQELVYEVRARFARQGTSLAAFCRNKEIDGGNIYRFLRGEVNSAKAKQERIVVLNAVELEVIDDN